MPVTNGARYFASTAVFLNEVVKLVICSAIVIREKAREGRPWSLAALWDEMFGGDAWKLAIPAALYTVLILLPLLWRLTWNSFKIIFNTLPYQILMLQHSKLHINLKSLQQHYSV
jgi:Nucleotide-sugar transporter